MNTVEQAPRGRDAWSVRAWLAAILLAVATFALYARTSQHEFIIIDDPGYVSGPFVKRGITSEGLRWAFAESHSSNWHPLTWLSHMLDVELFGDDAGKHHLVNAALHACNAALLFCALFALTRRFWPGVIVAALFAFHPQRVESVAWAAERKDVLSALFFFLALIAYAGYARRPSLARYLAVFTALACGLLAKSMLVTLPCVLLLLDRWPLDRWRRGILPPARLVLEKLPLVVLSALSCLMTVRAQAAGGALKPVDSLPLAARFSNAAVAYVSYVEKTVFPRELSIIYPHPALANGGEYAALSPASVWAALALFTACGAALACAHRCAWVTVGFFWFAGMLVPVIGVVQVGGQAMADRYTYLPVIGLWIAAVWSLAQLAGSVRRGRILVAAGLTLAGGYAALSWNYIGKWRDSATLLEHAVRVTQRNYSAHSNLGVVYLQRGELDLAIHHFEERRKLHPGTGVTLNLAIAYQQKGEFTRAENLFQQVLTRRARQFEANLYLGLIYSRQGDLARALSHLERAVQARPQRADARAALDAVRGEFVKNE